MREFRVQGTLQVAPLYCDMILDNVLQFTCDTIPVSLFPL